MSGVEKRGTELVGGEPESDGVLQDQRTGLGVAFKVFSSWRPVWWGLPSMCNPDREAQAAMWGQHTAMVFASVTLYLLVGDMRASGPVGVM